MSDKAKLKLDDVKSELLLLVWWERLAWSAAAAGVEGGSSRRGGWLVGGDIQCCSGDRKCSCLGVGWRERVSYGEIVTWGGDTSGH